ncbi:WhiB family transcriptional regulator [Enterococcus hirae]|uniref:WhiB family transcriptional regulator n=1 Tax=Enterococcus hirae TaxID=1354 RepID=UPI00136CF99B|nr:WhiB family transcriptional regulator [Enterococcus hirae]NAE18223.1 WhiB family transcriptional regulator [Enterococcus hirae]
MSGLTGGIGVCQTLPVDIVDELWFAESVADQRKAIALCQKCPIAQACLEQAIKDDVRWGVFGGRDFTRRYTAKFQRRAEAA